MVSSRACAVIALFLIAAAPLRAQCPDGSPPPCNSVATRTPVRTMDRNRLAVLPFRTSGADPALAHLGTGLVDLLAAELNGVVGPAAVDPGEAMREWERRGSGKAPTTQAAAIRVAQALGAGQVAYGSVVGSPRRFTVTVAILEVPGGASLIPGVQVDGTADSLAALVSRLSARIAGRALGALSPSDEAVREYNAGMVAYRKSGANELAARAHFERAVQIDSTFALPAYQLVLLRTLNGPSGPINPAALRTAWNQRQKLSVEQRVLLESMTDGNRMLFRMQMLPRMERAIGVTPNSPEAWDILGSLYFHVGALIGRENPLARAKQSFRRALDLDSSLPVGARPRLADIAFVEGDARTFDRYAALVAREGLPQVSVSWDRYRSALLNGNRRAIQSARRDAARDFVLANQAPPWFLGITLPSGEVDSIMRVAVAMTITDDQRDKVIRWRGRAAQIQGRPESANKLFHLVEDSNAIALIQLEAADETTSLVQSLFAQVERRIAQNDVGACEIGLAKIRHGDTTGVAALLGKLSRWDPSRDFAEIRPDQAGDQASGGRRVMVCAEVLSGVLASEVQNDSRALERADSLMRFMPLNCCDWWNYDIAVSYARRGRYADAARAVRRKWMVPGGASLRIAAPLRNEGRWAALAGDTAGAIEAYREYLRWRENPERSLIAQRDSVRAELALLERKRGQR